ncbi:hypothetical protein O181_051665 [Austropuccinia psidii MF-1]|uniref:Uncharacterized protein n=1 Tax=Austropuccinia psidii MF-1 TaxID=1389203 RepID=A0A9Q3DXI7_9BASI|nr:hypothetical protein [Austropuccinia psidii MF-1]
MHPVLQVAGVVHIWYYIPLCTIFAQQFNGDIFRTQFHPSKSRSQNPRPILKEDFLTHQSGNPWWQSEDHSRIRITWPCRSWLGHSYRIIPRALLRRYTSFQSVVKASSISILLGQLNWFIQAAINQPVCTWPNWANSYSTVGIQSHSSNSRWPELYWPDSDNTASDPPSGSIFQFFTYTGHLSAPGDFFPS